MSWFLRDDVARELRGIVRDATPEQRERFAARTDRGARDILRTATDVAEIPIEGVLTKRPDFWAQLLGLGNTSYLDVQKALASAAANPSIKRVQLVIDSPGGHVGGLFELLGALEVFRKPISVRASLAASAAYAIASAAGGKIEAVTQASEFGSIGVAATFFHDEGQIDIANTDSPNKRPDLATEEGQAIVRAELDALHGLFIQAIANGRTRAGRKTTAGEVNAEFGRGGMYVAKEAKRRGMIDRIAKPGQSDGDEEAAAERMADVWEAVREGKLRQRPGETDQQFVARYMQIADDGTLEEELRSGVPDFGDQVAAAYERSYPSAGRGAQVEPSPIVLVRESPRPAASTPGGAPRLKPGASADFGDAVAAAYERQFPSRGANS